MTRDVRKPFSLDEIKATMSPDQLERVRARVAELAAEEMSLAQLRKARALTQTALARKLGKTQALVSRIESAGDLYISTIRKQINAMGGDLDIRAVFPDRAPVSIAGFSELAPSPSDEPRRPHKGQAKTKKPKAKELKSRRRVGGARTRSRQTYRVAAKRA